MPPHWHYKIPASTVLIISDSDDVVYITDDTTKKSKSKKEKKQKNIQQKQQLQQLQAPLEAGGQLPPGERGDRGDKAGGHIPSMSPTLDDDVDDVDDVSAPIVPQQMPLTKSPMNRTAREHDNAGGVRPANIVSLMDVF